MSNTSVGHVGAELSQKGGGVTMEAPPGGMSVEQLNGFLDREIEGRYEHRDDGKRYCRTCGSVVQQTTCYVSEHEEVFGDGHVGRGSVQQIPLPYCPKCEGVPQRTSTCVHLRMMTPDFYGAGTVNQ